MFSNERKSGRPIGIQIVLVFVGVTVVLATGAVFGQVYQVGRYNSGSAIDASPMVGSGGINSVSGAKNPYNLGQQNTQLMVENRTTGLSSFHGRTGYYASDELNLRLPSTQMDTFTRQSVGVQDVLRGGTYETQPYYSRYSTTLSPRSIMVQDAAGQVVLPGQGMTAPVQDATQRMYKDATQDYLPLMPNEPINAVLGNALGTQPIGQMNIGELRAMDAEKYQATMRGGEGMFAMPHLQDRSMLAKELSDYSEDQLTGTPPIQPLDQKPLDQGLQQALEPQVIEPLGLTNQPGSVTKDITGATAEKETPGQLPLLPGASVTKSYLPEKNQDAYLDLLSSLQQKAQGSLEVDDETLDNPQENLLDPNRPALAMPGVGQAKPEFKTVTYSADHKIVLRSLAGTGKDMFNRYMARAKKELDAGRFYEAAQYYELASLTRPTNPLAKLGGCLAKFAAEEWYTSARDLQEAMELFPPLMETQLDLKTLLPTKKLDERLTSLELWVARVHDKPSLVFLAAFMQQNAGNTTQAKKHAAALKKMKIESPVMEAYVEYILTGTLPKAAKANAAKKNVSTPAGV